MQEMHTPVGELTMRPRQPGRLGEAAHVPVSVLLKTLIDEAPAEKFTLEWLVGSLPERSFGILMLVLGVLAMVPVGSMIPGLLLATLAAQMTVGRPGPVFPRRIALRPLPTAQLKRFGPYPIQALSHLERLIRPRWPALFLGGRRSIGILVLMLTLIVLLAPLPLTNMPPAAAIALISLAYIEKDGALLAAALLLTLMLVGIAAAAIWGAIVSAT